MAASSLTFGLAAAMKTQGWGKNRSVAMTWFRASRTSRAERPARSRTIFQILIRSPLISGGFASVIRISASASVTASSISSCIPFLRLAQHLPVGRLCPHYGYRFFRGPCCWTPRQHPFGRDIPVLFPGPVVKEPGNLLDELRAPGRRRLRPGRIAFDAGLDALRAFARLDQQSELLAPLRYAAIAVPAWVGCHADLVGGVQFLRRDS